MIDNRIDRVIINASQLNQKLSASGNVYSKEDSFGSLGIIEREPEKEEENNRPDLPEYWLASKIITDPERRFISDEDLLLLNHFINNGMSKVVYDSNNDGMVDMANRSLVADSVRWDNIENRPNVTRQEIETAVAHVHVHRNGTDLNRLTIDSLTLLPLWNNEPWPLPDRARPSDLFRERLRNIIMDAGTPVNSVDGDIWFQLNDSERRIVNIHARKNGQWYRLL